MAKARRKRTGPVQVGIYLLQYLAARSFAWLFGAFPPEQNLRTAETVANIWARFNPERLARATGNIHRALPNLSHEECVALAKASVRYMFRTYMVDAFQLPRVVTEESWQRHVDLSNARPGTKLMIGERPAIFLGPHAGNWELLGFFPTLMGFRMHALARPLDNPFIWQWAIGLRENRGMKIITNFGATEELQAIIYNGGRIAFIADQSAGNDGIFVPYFGQMASAYKSIALLAMRYDLPVAVGVALRTGNGFNFQIHTIDIIQPEDWRDHEDPVFYITARYTHAMERAIMRAPDQYLWIHRRWRARPKWEREGKPLPERIKAKLRTLPWINEAMIERISADTDQRVLERSSGAA